VAVGYRGASASVCISLKKTASKTGRSPFSEVTIRLGVSRARYPLRVLGGGATLMARDRIFQMSLLMHPQEKSSQLEKAWCEEVGKRGCGPPRGQGCRNFPRKGLSTGYDGIGSRLKVLKLVESRSPWRGLLALRSSRGRAGMKSCHAQWAVMTLGTQFV